MILRDTAKPHMVPGCNRMIGSEEARVMEAVVDHARHGRNR